MTKVGFFTTGMNVSSGFGRVSKYLLQGLAEKGYGASQFHLQFYGEPVTINGVKVYQGGDRDIHYFPRYLDEEKPDIVVFHRSVWDLCPALPTSWPAVAILNALRRRKMKLLLYCPLEHADADLTWLRKLYNDYPDVCLDIATVSEWSATQFVLAGWKNVYVIRHGVDRTVFNPNGPKNEWVREGKKVHVAGMVGFNQRRKDFPCLIDAYKYLTQYSEPSFYGQIGLYLHTNAVSGDRDLYDLTGNDEMIAFPYPPLDDNWGFSDEELATKYRSMDVYIHVAKAGGFEMPLLEAMACGIPVIAPKHSCIPEVAGDAALLVDWWREEQTNKGKWWLTHPMAVAKAWLQVMEKGGEVAKGLERVKTFTWERAVNDFTHMIQELQV